MAKFQVVRDGEQGDLTVTLNISAAEWNSMNRANEEWEVRWLRELNACERIGAKLQALCQLFNNVEQPDIRKRRKR